MVSVSQFQSPGREELFRAIARPSGGFAMVAIDQRETLRTMFAVQQPGRVGDETLIEFKQAVAELLSEYASAMLFDRLYGWPAFETAKTRSPSCGLIISADKLIQESGQVVSDTDLDEGLNLDEARRRGAKALKLLLIWKGEQNAERCRILAQEFMDNCHTVGLLGIIEAIVRPPDRASLSTWDKDVAIVDAARELGLIRPDLYKAEIPLNGEGDPIEIQAKCEAITAVLQCPWVVLSSGVRIEQFPAAVEAACRGGASGFLAGRGIWRDSIGPNPGEYRKRLQKISVPRLKQLCEIVDRNSRPWNKTVHD